MKKFLALSLLCSTLMSNSLMAFPWDGNYVQLSANFLKTHQGTKANLLTKRGEITFDKDWKMIGLMYDDSSNKSHNLIQLPANAYFIGDSATTSGTFTPATLDNMFGSGAHMSTTKGGNLSIATPASGNTNNQYTLAKKFLTSEEKVDPNVNYYLLDLNGASVSNWSKEQINYDPTTQSAPSTSASTKEEVVYAFQNNETLNAVLNEKSDVERYFTNFTTTAAIGSSSNAIASGDTVQTAGYDKLLANDIVKEIDVVASGKLTQEKDTLYGGSIKAGTTYRDLILEAAIDMNRIYYKNTDGERALYTNNFAFFGNFYYELDLHKIVTPYFGAGIGLNYSKIEFKNEEKAKDMYLIVDQTSGGKKTIKAADALKLQGSPDLMYNISGGFNVHCHQSLSVDFNYKFTAPLRSKGFEYKTEGEVNTYAQNKKLNLYNSLHNFSIGLKYFF